MQNIWRVISTYEGDTDTDETICNLVSQWQALRNKGEISYLTEENFS